MTWWRVVRVAALALILGAAGGSGARCAALGPADLLARLQGWLDGTRDLECRFDQTLVSGVLGEGVSESGRLYVERPGRMRWEYTRPEPKVALLSGGKALLYLPGDRQLIRGDPSWTSGPLLALLGGGAPLAELFEASAAGSDAGMERSLGLRLVPRSRMEGFEEVTVTLEPKSFAIVAAEVLDEAGNRMRFEFRELRRNRGLEDGLFVLVPAPGTEIIGRGE